MIVKRPKLMNEVAQDVKRDNLTVDKVFAMYQGPVEWNHVMEFLEKSHA